MLSKATDQQTLEIFDLHTRRRRRTPHVLRGRLNEVIFGKRKALRVHSKTLKTDIWFVNEGLVDPSDETFSGTVITMAHLAELMGDANAVSRLAEQMLV
jgi:hypothetical protein